MRGWEEAALIRVPMERKNKRITITPKQMDSRKMHIKV
jgi:hypothetical protein